jgi:aminoglycoside phosphotransferase (APT) family kinase protein
MSYQPIRRAPDAFQQPVAEEELPAICRRVFGARTELRSAVELAGGYYNNTFQLDIGAAQPVILRVAPEPARHTRADPQLMRNEHAALPFLAPIAALLPQTLAADFTHDLIGRDYLIQTRLYGVPADQRLGDFATAEQGAFFQQLGEITKAIHTVRGTGFGRVAGPLRTGWSEALLGWFDDLAMDLDRAELDAKDVRQLAQLVDRERAVLDDFGEPRLLHGDLWVGNVMLDRGAPVPTITGVFDCDRAWWGDPEADWPLYLARRRPSAPRDAFWEGYGRADGTPEHRWRELVYQARHAAALRVEYHRFGMVKEVAESYDEIREVIRLLDS